MTDSTVDVNSGEIDPSEQIAANLGNTDQSIQTDPAPDPNAGDNPAWKPLLSELPELFHPKTKDYLRGLDTNYRTLEKQYQDAEAKYKPYEPYIGVEPQNLQYGMNLLRLVNENPQLLYTQLETYLREQGQLPQTTPPANPNEDPDAQDLNKDPWQLEMDRRQAELDQQQQQINEYIQAQQYERQVESVKQDLDAKMTALVQKHGDSVDVEDVLARVAYQVDKGLAPDVESAFAESQATFRRIYERQTRGNANAPHVMSPGGSTAPTQTVAVEDMTFEQRTAYMKSLIDNANSGG